MICERCKKEAERARISGGIINPGAATGGPYFRGVGTMPDICQECVNTEAYYWSVKVAIEDKRGTRRDDNVD